MNTQDLIDAVAKSTGETKTAVSKVIKAVHTAIITSVKKGDTVRLMGFGSYSRVASKARTGRNPQTGATLKIAASKRPKFRAGSDFRKAVNGGR